MVDSLVSGPGETGFGRQLGVRTWRNWTWSTAWCQDQEKLDLVDSLVSGRVETGPGEIECNKSKQNNGSKAREVASRTRSVRWSSKGSLVPGRVTKPHEDE